MGIRSGAENLTRKRPAVAKTLAEEGLSDVVISVTINPAISTITADEDKFLRIMINLISNAVKFTPSGGHIDVVAAGDGDQGLGVGEVFTNPQPLIPIPCFIPSSRSSLAGRGCVGLGARGR